MTATLTGRLLAPDTGTPVLGTLYLTPPAPVAYGDAVVTRAPVKIPAGAGGVIHREGIVPGRYSLSVRPITGQSWSFPVDLTDGENRLEELLPATSTPQPILRGETGRGIASVTDTDRDGTATVTYTDGTTEELPLPAGPPGQQIKLDTDGIPYFTGV